MKAAIGIDIGGTNIQIGMVNRAGNMIAEGSFAVRQAQTCETFFFRLQEAIQKILSDAEVQLDGIGVGSPGADLARGVIANASNLPWGTIPIVEFLKNAFGVPVHLTNDANLFAIGEKIFGEAARLNDFTVITLGTGVGSGVYCGGELLLGRDGLAGELGHVVIERDGRKCACGRNGCLERYVSATGLVYSAVELLRLSTLPSKLRELMEEELSAAHIAEAARAGDPLAMEVFERTGDTLGLALANWVACTNPEAIFLGGGLARAGEVLFGPTIRSFQKNILPVYPDTVPILPCSLPGDSAGVLGAAALVWNNVRLNRNENSFVI